MKIRIYTEEAWDSYPHFCCGGFWPSEYPKPKWITSDEVKGILERAALHESDEEEEYIVASEDTVKRVLAEEVKRIQEKAAREIEPKVERYPYPIYTISDNPKALLDNLRKKRNV